MNHISTTATTVEKLKRSAKNLRKETRTSLAIALDTVAKSAGYDHWKHVTVCLQLSTSPHIATNSLQPVTLPSILVEFLTKQRNETPPAPALISAMKTGLVFAMDIKDAERMYMPDDFDESESIWTLAATDIWKVFIHIESDLTGKSLAQTSGGDELLTTVLEDLINYRFFVYSGANLPASLEEAFIIHFQDFEYRPVYVWLEGDFFDIGDTHQIPVDKKLVYYSSADVVSTYQVRNHPEDERPGTSDDNIVGWTPPHSVGQRYIPTLAISKMEPGLYRYLVLYGGEEMYSEVGFSSISEAIQDVSDVTGVDGYEVEYEGYMVGTYPIALVRNSSETIARDAIATAAQFMY